MDDDLKAIRGVRLVLTKLEWTVAVVLAAIAVGVLSLIGQQQGWTSSSMAAWVQAVGTIAAVLFVTVPVIVQHRLNRRHSRTVVLTAAEMAYGTMSEVARRYLDPDYVGSEWWVPQWDVLRKTLADCPIQRVGSVEAFESFVELQQLVARASIFDDPPTRTNQSNPIDSFVVTIMSNAGRQMEILRRTLKS